MSFENIFEFIWKLETTAQEEIQIKNSTNSDKVSVEKFETPKSVLNFLGQKESPKDRNKKFIYPALIIGGIILSKFII